MIEQDQITTADKKDVISKTARPETLKTYIGQDNIKKKLSVFTVAAKARNESLDHVLIYGGAGLGKTTLAHVITNEMQANIKSTSGVIINKAGDLVALLTNLQEHDVLFIDEIHKLNSAITEVLYPAMEDFEVDIIIGEGVTARSIKLSLPQFTLIGATTNIGALPLPLRDRFGINLHLEDYSVCDLMHIIENYTLNFGIKILPEAAKKIANCARGNPRVANKIIRRVRDYCQVADVDKITLNTAEQVLKLLEIDDLGLTSLDRKLINFLLNKNKPVGLETLVIALGEHKDVIVETIEPYLIKKGLICRTARGREATSKAKEIM